MYSNAVPIPSAFRCAVDGRWLTPNHFSQRQISKWQQQKRRLKDGVTPSTIGLICKQHAQENQRQMEPPEIHCNGPCGAWKPREQFSKNQRNIESPRCISCTFWAINIGRREAPTAPPGVIARSQGIANDSSSIQDGVVDDQTSHTGTNATVTGTTAVHSSEGNTTMYQPSGVTSGQRRNIGAAHGTPTSVIQDTQNPRSAAVGDNDPPDRASLTNFTGHFSLKGELVMMRGPSSGLDPTPPKLQGNAASAQEDKPQLYDHNPFAPNARSTENSATNATSRVPVPDSRQKDAKGKWAKPDSRKVFYADDIFDAPQGEYETHDPDWQSDDEVDF